MIWTNYDWLPTMFIVCASYYNIVHMWYLISIQPTTTIIGTYYYLIICIFIHKIVYTHNWMLSYVLLIIQWIFNNVNMICKYVGTT